MKPLLSSSQMQSLQRLAEAGFQTEVTILRPTFGSDEKGDDAYDDDPATVVQPASVLRNGKLFGYLRQTGGDTVGGVDIAQIVTSSTFELGMPVGTDVRPRDIAVIGDRRYPVQDVKDDETWPAMVNATLRRKD